MSDQEFERLLTQALIQSARQTWIETPSEEVLLSEFPETKVLDERIRRIKPDLVVTIPKRVPIYRRAGRYAAMFFLCLTVLFGALMLHPGARAYIVNLVTTWYEDHIRYSFREEGAETIPTDWVFGYIPEGFALVFEERSDTDCTFQYEGVDGALLVIYISNESGTLHADNERHEISQKIIRGGIVDIYEGIEDRDSNMIVWYREDLRALVTVIGDVSTEELIAVLEALVP